MNWMNLTFGQIGFQQSSTATGDRLGSTAKCSIIAWPCLERNAMRVKIASTCLFFYSECDR